MSDARISTALPGHPKTKKLIRRLGQAGGWNLVCLFLWAAANRSDGDLGGMSNEDIELAANWEGDEGEFVRALVAVRYLDGEPEAYTIHDWAEHNPWAAGAEMRSAKARWNAVKRHHGDAEADRQVPEYAAIRSATSSAASTNVLASSNAPSPSPSPSLEALQPKDGCPHADIVAAYHEALPANPRIKAWTGTRQSNLRARWREDEKRQSLDYWQRFFRHVASSPFLTGKRTGQDGRPFLPGLDWLVKPDNFAKVIEGRYHDQEGA